MLRPSAYGASDEKNLDDELEKQRLDLQLDKELQETFPASDALKITRRQRDMPKQPAKRKSQAWTRTEQASRLCNEHGGHQGEAS